MVDRLFWRAGFGPSQRDRQTWTGQPVNALIDWFMSTPYALAPAAQPATWLGQPIDPTGAYDELQLEWLDRMRRVTNPLIERLNFFWHRHFAVSIAFNIPYSHMLTYRDRLAQYSDLASNPTASFADLALEMTTEDAAMSVWLSLEENIKYRPNENYAREFMELFTLGVLDANGSANYSQTDVEQLARAFTGYRLDLDSGTIFFKPQLFDAGLKTILGQSAAFDAPAAVQLVLSQPSHAPFLVSKLWAEFIAAPIPADALSALVAAYVYSGWQIAPVIRGILSHPLIFDSLEEPTMIKPPVVYAVGVVRALGVPLEDGTVTAALWKMGQQPYHPPNVAGWEGGLSWLNTATAVARFNLITACQALLSPVADVPDETADAALARAYADCGSPWLSSGTISMLESLSLRLPALSKAQRLSRQYAFQAFILGGPDGQMM